MSKKEQVVELLKSGTSIEDICSQIEVSKSYVYRIQREMDESEGDPEDGEQTKNDSGDGVVESSSGGAGSNVEGHKESLESEEGKGNTNKTDRLGGVKKKKRTRKSVKKNTKVNSEQGQNSPKLNGVKVWIMKKWKTMLLLLTGLTLLVLLMLFPSKTVEKEPMTRPPRFPMIVG